MNTPACWPKLKEGAWQQLPVSTAATQLSHNMLNEGLGYVSCWVAHVIHTTTLDSRQPWKPVLLQYAPIKAGLLGLTCSNYE
jgi:hypothetical protein